MREVEEEEEAEEEGKLRLNCGTGGFSFSLTSSFSSLFIVVLLNNLKTDRAEDTCNLL